MDKKTNDYSVILSQVSGILEYLPKEFYKMIPQKMLTEIEKNKSREYEFKYEIEKGLDDSRILEETKDFISGIYLLYLCDDKEKKDIIEICKKNDIKFQKELEEKYSVDNLFKMPEKEIIDENCDFSKEDNSQVLAISEEKWYIKIIKKVKEFLLFIKK